METASSDFDRRFVQESTMLFTAFLEQVCNQGRESVPTQYQKQYKTNVNKRELIVNKNSCHVWPYSIWTSISLERTVPVGWEIPSKRGGRSDQAQWALMGSQPQLFFLGTLRTPSPPPDLWYGEVLPERSPICEKEASFWPGYSSLQLQTQRNSGVVPCYSTLQDSFTPNRVILGNAAIMLNINIFTKSPKSRL